MKYNSLLDTAQLLADLGVIPAGLQEQEYVSLILDALRVPDNVGGVDILKAQGGDLYLTLIHEGGILIFFRRVRGKPTFFWCLPSEISAIKYDDWIEKEIRQKTAELAKKLPQCPLSLLECTKATFIAGQDYDLYQGKNGLIARRQTFTDGNPQASRAAEDFKRTFTSKRPNRIAKRVKAKEDEDGIALPSLHPVHPFWPNGGKK